MDYEPNLSVIDCVSDHFVMPAFAQAVLNSDLYPHCDARTGFAFS